MSHLAFLTQKIIAVSVSSPAPRRIKHNEVVISVQTAPRTHRMLLATTLAAIFLLVLPGLGSAQAQTATVDWTDVHQVIDGFGGASSGGSSMSSANQSFFFGTGPGQLGLSILRVPVTNNGSTGPGSCASVSTSCAGVYVGDMQAALANGAKVYATPWSPPAAYTTNSSTICTAGSGNGALATGSYASYATWLANFVQSLQTEFNIPLFAISVQNEPDQCKIYDSALWTAGQFDSFIANNLGAAFSSDGLSTLIFMPENSGYGGITGNNGGGTCMTDSSCSNYVGGVNFHDYDASVSGTDTVNSTPYPSGWDSGKKYWETEVSCGSGFGPSGCNPSYTTSMSDGLLWAAIIDHRLAVDGVNAWLYWWLVENDATDNEGLISNSTPYPQRAYVLGQYSKFVRPGYSRIDATHLPQTGVSVSAYQNTGTNTLAIIATNYTSSPVSQTFNLTNAPAFSTLTPTTTSASLNLAAQANVSVSSNSFTYTLPAQSITTFVGSASAPPPPTNLAGTVAQ